MPGTFTNSPLKTRYVTASRKSVVSNQTKDESGSVLALILVMSKDLTISKISPEKHPCTWEQPLRSQWHGTMTPNTAHQHCEFIEVAFTNSSEGDAYLWSRKSPSRIVQLRFAWISLKVVRTRSLDGRSSRCRSVVVRHWDVIRGRRILVLLWAVEAVVGTRR